MDKKRLFTENSFSSPTGIDALLKQSNQVLLKTQFDWTSQLLVAFHAAPHPSDDTFRTVLHLTPVMTHSRTVKHLTPVMAHSRTVLHLAPVMAHSRTVLHLTPVMTHSRTLLHLT